MLYSILKDEKPKNTVAKIKKIISELKIELKEEYFIDNSSSAPVSVRLTFKNNSNIGTNGKGTCIENALASAYAEFMERLQNLVLIPDNADYIQEVMSDIFQTNEDITWEDVKLNEYFADKLQTRKIFSKKNLLLAPFYSVKNGVNVDLPIQLIGKIVGTNGMAAGNTLEEAIVQGLSEICERYAIKEIFKNKISIPDIPQELYMQYDNIKKIINYYKDNGFKIYIKDASLNGKVPVICTVFEDIINNVYILSIGSHPSFPISIERTLTEFTQGIILSERRKSKVVPYPYFSNERLKHTSLGELCNSLFLSKNAYAKSAIIKSIFLNDKPKYNVSQKDWISANKTYTNKELLKYLTDKVLKIADDIYIRNVSFLSFPSVYIFVPKLSDVVYYTEKNLSKESLDILWENYNKNQNKQDYNIESLLKLSEIYTYTEWSESRKIFNVPFEYVALLCSIVLKDAKRVKKYIKLIFAQNEVFQYYTDNQIEVLNIIKEYFSCLEKKDKLTSKSENLKKKYKKCNIDYAFEVINKLTFELILEIVIKKTKVKTFNNKKLISLLKKEYKKHPLKQTDLKNLFCF